MKKEQSEKKRKVTKEILLFSYNRIIPTRPQCILIYVN